MANGLDCDIVAIEFERHFRTNLLEKGKKPPYLFITSYGLNSSNTNVLLQHGFDIKQPLKVDMPLNQRNKPKPRTKKLMTDLFSSMGFFAWIVSKQIFLRD